MEQENEKKEAVKKERLVAEGNAFYEIDLECVERKKRYERELERRRTGRR